MTVKLKDHGIAQRFRTLTASRIREQVETSTRANAATKHIKIVAAHQLKSGDIQIFTGTTAEATKLKDNRGWLRGLGEHAELIVPTYGVIVHGIATNSINIRDQRATIQQIVADNYTVIPKAEISFVGWLTKESPTQACLIYRGRVCGPGNGQCHHLCGLGMGRTNPHLPALRPCLQGKAMFPLL